MFSVVMPAFNTERFIANAILSIDAQNVDCEVELLVVNDGSTDGTVDVIDQLDLKNLRLRLFESENRGVSHARNVALRQLDPKCAFVTFLDSDDMMAEGRLAADLDRFEKENGLELALGLQCLVTSEAPDLRGDIATPPPTIRSANLASVTMSRSLIEKTGFFDETLTHGEDLDYLLRVLERRPNSVMHDEIGMYYRQRQHSACTNLRPLMEGVANAVNNHKARRIADPELRDVENVFLAEDFATKLARANNAFLLNSGYPDYSVVIPAFNAEPFLNQTLRSVFAQTHPPSDVVVVDDGSTDGTVDVIASLQIAHPHIRLIQQSNKGPAEATNAGVRHAKHDLIAFLDADDLWEPEKNAIQIRTLLNNRGAEIVSCKIKSFKDGENNIFADDDKSGWVRSTMMVRRSVFDKIGYMHTFQSNFGEVIDWLARTREEDIHTVFLDEFLSLRRLHEESLSAGQRNEQAVYLEAARAAILRQRMRTKKNAQ